MEAEAKDTTNRRKRPDKKNFQSMMATKMRHLKKKDGEPLWRADIQYDFLSAIFRNEQKVFTSAYQKKPGFTFADIYIEAMAESTRCSKVLGEKLRTDREAGIGIAMVCLLVNIGRMNTTLNFFPEMKAQLRTYHPIPSLQSNTNADYKQLQDAPRLKSILKGACENQNEPSTFEELKASKLVPKTNPVNVLFLLTSFNSRIEEQMFDSTLKFYDLLMNENLSSSSRARSFLWLMWAWLESDLSPEQLKLNPFGDGEGTVPIPYTMTAEEKALENIDTPAEISFGKQKTLQRLTYLEGSVPQPPRRRAGPTIFASNQSNAVSLPTPRTAKERKIYDEFATLLKEKRTRRKERRQKAGNVIRLWSSMKDIDAGYDSETEFFCKDSGSSEAMVAVGVTNEGGDYGELVSSFSRSLRTIAKKLNI
ncbi:Ino eighty subunit 1 [Wickerhamiella sorbophila]|uniref:Ino eighty subunit 1 n=1 Tax=Wickerhamiella sorbophila TaxID=45607 RepID=A0A2T0FBV2_9ASCO|nr:Ino eighty subunit 1 [Wickerhamiella sorbophila]PRT52447.1 Ino eighty subunit 1 [Wickerhamiella sorbophila]